MSLDQVSDSIREIEEVLDAYRVDDHAKGPLYSKMHEVYTTFQIIMGRNAGYMEIMEQRDDPDFHIYKYAPMNSAECELLHYKHYERANESPRSTIQNQSGNFRDGSNGIHRMS